MKNVSQEDLKKICDEYGFDQIIMVARKGGKMPSDKDKQCYASFGVDKAPWWMNAVRKLIFRHNIEKYMP